MDSDFDSEEESCPACREASEVITSSSFVPKFHNHCLKSPSKAPRECPGGARSAR